MGASRRLFPAIAVATSLLSGCGKSETTQYYACSAGETCSSGTSCVTTEFPDASGSKMLCTLSCELVSDCPGDAQGNQVDCVLLSSTAPGQCFADCSNDPNTCAAEGTTCQVLGGFEICAP